MLNKNLNNINILCAKNILIDVTHITIILIVVFSYVKIEPISPDSELYLGLAKNILNGTGYYDTIRNDEILPPIGHPLLIAISLQLGISANLFAFTLLISSFVLLYFALKNIKLHLLFIPLLLLFIDIVPSFFLYGIELSILFSFMFLYYVFTLWIRRRKKQLLVLLFLFVGFNLTIRPILLPFIVIFSLFALLMHYKNGIQLKEKVFGGIFLGIVSMILLLSMISIFSFQKYGDNRYLLGTYSSIPLYCAWNDYIDLKQRYTSTIWKSLDKERYDVAIMPLINTSGWKERDILIKRKVLEFLLNNPHMAMEGYVWRFGKFTLNSDNKNYIVVIIFWILSSATTFLIFNKISGESKKQFIASLILSIYVIFFSAFFVYVGQRYLLTPLIFLIFSITINLYILFKCAKLYCTKRLRSE